MTAVLATKATVILSKNGDRIDEFAIHTQCKALNLQRAKTVRYMVLVENGVITEVATVYAVAPSPERWGGGGRVNFAVLPNAPADVEALVGTPLTWAGKNPNAYYTLEDGELTKA